MPEACTVRIEHVAADGTATVLKELALEAGEVIDAACMSCKALEAFYEKATSRPPCAPTPDVTLIRLHPW